jgi:hypothetical protein
VLKQAPQGARTAVPARSAAGLLLPEERVEIGAADGGCHRGGQARAGEDADGCRDLLRFARRAEGEPLQPCGGGVRHACVGSTSERPESTARENGGRPLSLRRRQGDVAGAVVCRRPVERSAPRRLILVHGESLRQAHGGTGPVDRPFSAGRGFGTPGVG